MLIFVAFFVNTSINLQNLYKIIWQKKKKKFLIAKLNFKISKEHTFMNPEFFDDYIKFYKKSLKLEKIDEESTDFILRSEESEDYVLIDENFALKKEFKQIK